MLGPTRPGLPQRAAVQSSARHHANCNRQLRLDTDFVTPRAAVDAGQPSRTLRWVRWTGSTSWLRHRRPRAGDGTAGTPGLSRRHSHRRACRVRAGRMDSELAVDGFPARPAPPPGLPSSCHRDATRALPSRRRVAGPCSSVCTCAGLGADSCAVGPAHARAGISSAAAMQTRGCWAERYWSGVTVCYGRAHSSR